MDLGAPIGTHTSYTGQGQQTGLTGSNTSSTPIADKFSTSNPNARQYDTTNQTTGQALQDKASEILTGHTSSHQTSGQGYNTTSTSGQGYDNSTSGSYGSSQTTGQNLTSKAENLLHGNSASGQGLTGDNAVSGQYAGGGVRDALTGESHAQRTGAGVGPLGENLGSGAGHRHHHHHDNTATGITNAGVRDGESYGTGVGAAGGAGGHYSSAQTGTAVGAGAGLGAAGAYAAGQHSSSRQGENYGVSGQTGDYNNSSSNTDNNNNSHTSHGGITGGQGPYGKASDGDFNRGAPLSKDLDTGNPHSLVYQESTGKYVHRRDL